MTLTELRRKAHDRTPVRWRAMGAYGTVTRVAKDGTWADMEWWQGTPTEKVSSWRKRQPLNQIDEWEHG